MKTLAISSFFVLFALVAGIVATTPAAFADHSEVTIVAADESGFGQDCGADNIRDNECYVPGVATVDVGGKVIMTNTDNTGLAHSFTSGTVDGFAPSPDGIFDSGLLDSTVTTDPKNPTSYEWNPDTVGEYPYYCFLHTWMQGTIIVQEVAAEEDETHMDDDKMMDDDGMKMDDAKELMVMINDSAVMGGTQVELEFNQLHVNYEITAKQNGETILKETAHAMEMTASHMVDAVGSDENPISVEVVSLGIGPPGAEADWTGPVGLVATSMVVPEFGTIAMMVLAVAIISIVAVTAKSRVIPRF